MNLVKEKHYEELTNNEEINLNILCDKNCITTNPSNFYFYIYVLYYIISGIIIYYIVKKKLYKPFLKSIGLSTNKFLHLWTFHTLGKRRFLYSKNYIKIIYCITLMNNEELIKENLLLREENEKLKKQLENYNNSRKSYYEKNKDLVNQKAKERLKKIAQKE